MIKQTFNMSDLVRGFKEGRSAITKWARAGKFPTSKKVRGDGPFMKWQFTRGDVVELANKRRGNIREQFAALNKELKNLDNMLSDDELWELD